MGADMQQYDGVCQMCGYVKPVLAMDQEDADDKITEQCDCGAADKLQQLKMMKHNLEATIGEKAMENGFTTVESSTKEIIMEVAQLIFDEKIGKATFVLEDSTVMISMSAKGGIKTSRKKIKALELEA